MILCRIWHCWSPWSEPEKKTFNKVSRNGFGQKLYEEETTLIVQERVCSRCGQYQRRLLTLGGSEVKQT